MEEFMDELRERLVRYFQGNCDEEMIVLLRTGIARLPDEEVAEMVARLDQCFDQLREALAKLATLH